MSDCEPPRLVPTSQLQPALLERVVDEQTYEGLVYSNQTVEGLTANHLNFHCCLFQRVHLNFSTFKHLGLRDCRFEQCDVSNADWTGAHITRVGFVGCKLTGAKLDDSVLEDVAVDECVADYLQLQFAKTKRLVLRKTSLEQAYFQESDVRLAIMTECMLSRADFSKARMHGLNLRTSTIDGIRLAPSAFEGLKVDMAQALYLMQTLGAEIE